MSVERFKITPQETKALRILAKKRGRFAKAFRLEGTGNQEMHPRIVNVSFDVTQEVAAALRALRDTGFYGNGVDCASIAEELLRRALRDPEIAAHWQKGHPARLRFDPPSKELQELLRSSAKQLRKTRKTRRTRRPR